MAFNTLPAPADGFRLAPVEPRHAPLFCFALLTLSCALASPWLPRRCCHCVPRCSS
jgi:hypothetical protein